MVEKISREYLVSRTVEMMNVELPKLSNKTPIREIVRARFNRTNSDLYPMFDAFFYSIITAVCDQMESEGVKQPSASDFLSAFRRVQGIVTNIGNLHIENFQPTEEYTKRVTELVINKITKTYDLKLKQITEDDVDELDREFERYENFDNDEEVGINEQ